MLRMTPLGYLFKQAFHKRFPVKQLQVVHAFAYANIFHRYFKLIGYADHYTAFGCAIQLGKG